MHFCSGLSLVLTWLTCKINSALSKGVFIWNGAFGATDGTSAEQPSSARAGGWGLVKKCIQLWIGCCKKGNLSNLSSFASTDFFCRPLLLLSLTFWPPKPTLVYEEFDPQDNNETPLSKHGLEWGWQNAEVDHTGSNILSMQQCSMPMTPFWRVHTKGFQAVPSAARPAYMSRKSREGHGQIQVRCSYRIAFVARLWHCGRCSVFRFYNYIVMQHAYIIWVYKINVSSWLV